MGVWGGFGDGEEEGVLGVGFGAVGDVEAGGDAALGEAVAQVGGGEEAAEKEFLEPGAAVGDFVAGQLGDAAGGVVGALVAEFG